MDFKELLLYIENHGISIVISGMVLFSLYKYLIPYLKASIETQQEILTFMKGFNNEMLKGKGLELVFNLKTQELRWSIQKRVIQYITNNNLAINWDIILKELDLKIDEKKHTLYTELRDIVEKHILNAFLEKVDNKLIDTHTLVVNLMEELKDNGSHDKNLYEVAKRAVETHFENFENEMHREIKEIME